MAGFLPCNRQTLYSHIRQIFIGYPLRIPCNYIDIRRNENCTLGKIGVSGPLSREQHHVALGFGGILPRRHRDDHRESGRAGLGPYHSSRGAAGSDPVHGLTPQHIPASTGGIRFPPGTSGPPARLPGGGTNEKRSDRMLDNDTISAHFSGMLHQQDEALSPDLLPV